MTHLVLHLCHSWFTFGLIREAVGDAENAAGKREETLTAVRHTDGPEEKTTPQDRLPDVRSTGGKTRALRFLLLAFSLRDSERQSLGRTTRGRRVVAPQLQPAAQPIRRGACQTTGFARQTKERRGMPDHTNKPNCLVAGCNEPTRSRGLCEDHYSDARRQLRLTNGTWADLEKAGLALPRGVQRLNDFSRQVREASLCQPPATATESPSGK